MPVLSGSFPRSLCQWGEIRLMETKPLKSSECDVTRSCDKITQELKATMRKVMLKMFGKCCLTMSFFCLKLCRVSLRENMQGYWQYSHRLNRNTISTAIFNLYIILTVLCVYFSYTLFSPSQWLRSKEPNKTAQPFAKIHSSLSQVVNIRNCQHKIRSL